MCLAPETMEALLLDEEFMEFVSDYWDGCFRCYQYINIYTGMLLICEIIN
jgi:hypothetical protein